MIFYSALTAIILAYWGPHIADTYQQIRATNDIPFERLPYDLGGLALVVFIGSQVKRSWDQRHHGGKPKVSKKKKRTIDQNIKVPK